MTNAILALTDGVTRVNMLSILEGYSVENWRQAVAQFKARGTWQHSALSDGRRLVNTQYDNVRESFPIPVIKGEGQDDAVRVLLNFLRLGIKASSYWTAEFQKDPVWIEKRAECETETSYAIVYTSSMPDISDIFSPTFLKDAVLPDLVWEVERDHWGETQPGVGTAVALSAVELYDGRSLGNVDSTGTRQATTAAGAVFVANKRTEANLTDVYTWSAVNGWSANLMDAALPYDLIDVAGAAPAVNDFVLFGIDTAVADSGPFCSLVFDIGTAGAGFTGHWEYSTAGGWGVPSVQDNTDAAGAMTGETFDTTGINSVHWVQPVVFAPQANGPGAAITAYWFRYVVDTVPGPITAPTQQNRDVYTITWPYIELAEGQIEGDLPAQMWGRFVVRSDRNFAWAGDPALWSNRFIVGLRSVTRGNNFSAYINIANEQNPPGITVASIHATTTLITDATAPTGICAHVNFAGVLALVTVVEISFNASIVMEYYGDYHAFLRVKQVGGSAGDVTVELLLYAAGVPILRSGEQTLDFTDQPWQLIDCGRFNIPGTDYFDETDTTDNLTFRIAASNSNAVPPDLYLYDLILIPTDEYAVDVKDSQGGGDWWVGGDDSTGFPHRALDLDSVEYPKHRTRALVRTYDGNNYIRAPWLIIANNAEFISQSGTRQRYWVLSERNTYTTVGGEYVYASEPYVAACVQQKRRQRYLTLRGDR